MSTLLFPSLFSSKFGIQDVTYSSSRRRAESGHLAWYRTFLFKSRYIGGCLLEGCSPVHKSVPKYLTASPPCFVKSTFLSCIGLQLGLGWFLLLRSFVSMYVFSLTHGPMCIISVEPFRPQEDRFGLLTKLNSLLTFLLYTGSIRQTSPHGWVGRYKFRDGIVIFGLVSFLYLTNVTFKGSIFFQSVTIMIFDRRIRSPSLECHVPVSSVSTSAMTTPGQPKRDSSFFQDTSDRSWKQGESVGRLRPQTLVFP